MLAELGMGEWEQKIWRGSGVREQGCFLLGLRLIVGSVRAAFAGSLALHCITEPLAYPTSKIHFFSF